MTSEGKLPLLWLLAVLSFLSPRSKHLFRLLDLPSCLSPQGEYIYMHIDVLSKLMADVHSCRYPAGVFNLVNGLGRTTGDALSRHMDIDKIAFTGSTITGRRIAIAAAESNLKSVTLELGGKSANIVFDDANLQEAAKWAAFGVYENMGA